MSRYAEEVRQMRDAAQQTLRSGVYDLVAEIVKVAQAAEQALGTISIDEAWATIEQVCKEHCRKQRGA